VPGTAPPSLPAESLPPGLPVRPAISDRRPPVGFVLHVPILMYHRVLPSSQATTSLPSLVVSPELFAAQLRALHDAGWHTLTMAELLAVLQAGREVPAHTFVITIDDGWDDGYRYALPILEANGFRATFFVVAGRIGTDPGALTPDHVRALSAAGNEIGDHTLDHVEVTHLDPAHLHYEIVAAAARIAQLCGTWPIDFAYPFGRVDAQAIAELQADGFGLAVTTHEGTVVDWPNRLALPRLRVGPGTSATGLLAEVIAAERPSGSFAG
jgi:peptidoglycan/xylan/chitin deacetylase (PgdA/CDA1 family)